MRLPFPRFERRSDRTGSSAPAAFADRLDRLIAVGERTNQLLEQLLVTAPPTAEAGEIRPPRPESASDRIAGSAVPRGRKSTQTPAKGSRQRGKTRGGRSQQATGQAPRKLHEAIIQVLLEAGEPLTAHDLAARIRERELFEPPRSGHELRAGQVSARVGNATYRHRFVRRDGRIWLADPDGERRGDTGP